MGAVLHGLLLGHGRMGRLHARKLRARADVRLSITDPGQGLQAPPHGRWDFGIVATPTPTHAALARELLTAGVPVLVEKPVAGSTAEAESLAGLPGLAVGHSERFHPAVRALRAETADHTPRFLQFRRLAPPPGGGVPEIDVIWDVMVHDLDLALAWMGPRWQQVRATGLAVLGGGIDIAEARVEWAHGVATFVASRVSPARMRSVQLVAPGAYWSADLVAATAHRRSFAPGQAPGAATALHVDARDAIDAEHDAFLAMVRHGTPYPVDGPSGLAAVRLAAAVQRACTAALATPAGADGSNRPPSR